MTIRNTLQDYGQRFRPRMACLKKVSCLLTGGAGVVVPVDAPTQEAPYMFPLRNVGLWSSAGASPRPNCVGICSQNVSHRIMFIFSTGPSYSNAGFCCFGFRKAFITHIDQPSPLIPFYLQTATRKIDEWLEIKALIAINCMSISYVIYACKSGCYLTYYNDKIRTFRGSRHLKSTLPCEIR